MLTASLSSLLSSSGHCVKYELTNKFSSLLVSTEHCVKHESTNTCRYCGFQIFTVHVTLAMDLSPLGFLRLSLPKVPLLAKSALLHTLWLSPTSTKVDLKTELVVAFIRSLLDSPTPNPISKQQAFSLKDPGIKGRMWVSKVTFPAPVESQEQDVLALLTRAIDDLKNMPNQQYTIPEVLPVEAEWTGYRPNVHKDRERPCLSEQEHYENLMNDTTSDVTILYFHGGAHYMMDPATHRPTCARLAQLTGGRCLSVRYRLAPQNPFPAALLDGLIAYLSLLRPPPGSLHKPVPASKIIFAGDSAGGNICFALLQLLLQINRTSSASNSSSPNPSSFSFHANAHSLPLSIPLPAALACTSPWLDTSRSLPSITTNAPYDYLPAPLTPHRIATFPTCPLWPTTPPRGDLYSDLSMLTHPLVSPLAARTESWRGSPPVWFGLGEEMLADEMKVVAARIATGYGGGGGGGGGVVPVVRWEQYEGQCHCFGQIFESLGSVPAQRMMRSWAAFCRDAVDGTVSGTEAEANAEANAKVKGQTEGHADGQRQGQRQGTKGLFIRGKACDSETEVDVRTLSPFSDEDVLYAMRKAQKAREGGREGEAKILPRL